MTATIIQLDSRRPRTWAQLAEMRRQGLSTVGLLPGGPLTAAECWDVAEGTAELLQMSEEGLRPLKTHQPRLTVLKGTGPKPA